jgi:dTDP-4-dehydrorhamnose reductase
MKILIFGANGLLGLELNRVLSEASHEIIPFSLSEVDIRSELVARSILEAEDFELLIFAKGYEDIYAAEDNEKVAHEINETGARNLAEICRDKGAAMMYISTAYVFDGEQESPYLPTDKPNPINAYGRSKLAGEIAIQETINNFYVIRTSKIFGEMKQNFVDDLIDKARTGQDFKAFKDLKYTPTWTYTIAKTIEKIISSTRLKINYGVYHCTNSGSCSDYEFISDVVRLMQLGNRIQAVRLSDARHKVNLPRYCVLDSSQAPGIRIHWHDALQNYLRSSGYIN